MLPRQPLGHATSGSSAALMGGASTMGTGAMGGTTVETIVMREDVVSLKTVSVFLFLSGFSDFNKSKSSFTFAQKLQSSNLKFCKT